MPRYQVRCRTCKAEYGKNQLDDMSCKDCGGLLIKVNTHLDRRIERAKKNYILDSLLFNSYTSVSSSVKSVTAVRSSARDEFPSESFNEPVLELNPELDKEQKK